MIDTKVGKPVATGHTAGVGGHHRVVFFVRCHEFPEFVADTVDAIQFYSVSNPLIVVTVDRNERIERELRRSYPHLLYFTSPHNCGWGGGLFRLFCEAACWLLREKQVTFDYLWNVDYDLLPIRAGFDEFFVERFRGDPAIGQVGRHNANSNFWIRRMRQQLGRLKKTYSQEGVQWPRNYKVGDHVAGACGIFKGNCVAQMLATGLLEPPFSDLGETCKLADDPMLSLMTYTAGYKFRDMGDKAYIKWRMEEDFRKIPERGYYLYHPTKLVPGNGPYNPQTEKQCRDFFRGLRGQGVVTMLPDSPHTGRPTSILC